MDTLWELCLWGTLSLMDALYGTNMYMPSRQGSEWSLNMGTSRVTVLELTDCLIHTDEVGNLFRGIECLKRFVYRYHWFGGVATKSGEPGIYTYKVFEQLRKHCTKTLEHLEVNFMDRPECTEKARNYMDLTAFEKLKEVRLSQSLSAKKEEDWAHSSQVVGLGEWLNDVLPLQGILPRSIENIVIQGHLTVIIALSLLIGLTSKVKAPSGLSQLSSVQFRRVKNSTKEVEELADRWKMDSEEAGLKIEFC